MADQKTVTLSSPDRVLFPDEYSAPFPSVQLRNAVGEVILRVEFPAETEHPKEPDEEIFHVSFFYRGDGVTATYTVPYKLVSASGG